MRILIFGTVFEADKARADLTDLWIEVHHKLNLDCDLLLIDSLSPHRPEIITRHPWFKTYMTFHDNIGHAGRKGRDGWGRAFCAGLQYAVDHRFDYVAHVEGDSLLRLPVRPICEQMRTKDIKVASAEVSTGVGQTLPNWVETGLMFFEVAWLQQSDFIKTYDWPSRQAGWTPEAQMTRLVGDVLKIMPWRVIRNNNHKMTAADVGNYDWVTQLWGHDEFYQQFADMALCQSRSSSDVEVIT